MKLITKHQALCKFRGCLVIAELSLKDIPPEKQLKCPNCYGYLNFESFGWLQCSDCDFALLKEAFEKIKKEREEFLIKKEK